MGGGEGRACLKQSISILESEIWKVSKISEENQARPSKVERS